MSSSTKNSSSSAARKIILGAAVVLLINSFLPWISIDFGPFGSATANGWHGIGVIAWLFVIAVLVLEGTRLAGVLPLSESRADLASLASSVVAILFGLIFVIIRLVDGFLGFGFFIGLVALIVLGFGAFSLYRTSTAMAELKNLQASTRKDLD